MVFGLYELYSIPFTASTHRVYQLSTYIQGIQSFEIYNIFSMRFTIPTRRIYKASTSMSFVVYLSQPSLTGYIAHWRWFALVQHVLKQFHKLLFISQIIKYLPGILAASTWALRIFSTAIYIHNYLYSDLVGVFCPKYADGYIRHAISTACDTWRSMLRLLMDELIESYPPTC